MGELVPGLSTIKSNNLNDTKEIVFDESQPIKIEQIIDIITTSNNAQYASSKVTEKPSNEPSVKPSTAAKISSVKPSSALKKSLRDKRAKEASSTKSNKRSINIKNLSSQKNIQINKPKVFDSRRLKNKIAIDIAKVKKEVNYLERRNSAANEPIQIREKTPVLFKLEGVQRPIKNKNTRYGT